MPLAIVLRAGPALVVRLRERVSRGQGTRAAGPLGRDRVRHLPVLVGERPGNAFINCEGVANAVSLNQRGS